MLLCMLKNFLLSNTTYSCITYLLLSSFQFLRFCSNFSFLFSFWLLLCSLFFFINKILPTKYKFSICFLAYLKRELSSQKTIPLNNDSVIDKKKETRVLVLVMFFSSAIMIFSHCWHIFDIFSTASILTV